MKKKIKNNKKYMVNKINKIPKVQKRDIQQDTIQNKDFPVDYYSYSSIAKFSTNPILFKIRYINRETINSTMNVSGVIGQAFHKAMEVYYGGNDNYKPISASEAIKMSLETGMDFLEKYPEGWIEYSSSIKNKQKAFEYLSFLINSYVKEKPLDSNKAEIISTEEELLEDVDVKWKGKRLKLPVPLKGYIDKVEKKDGKLTIVDYKTCRRFSDPEKIDGRKMLQAVQYYLLAYAKYGIEPYSMRYEEVKMTKNRGGGKQVKEYEIIYDENELFFDFYFRFYEDITKALNGQQVFVPNINTFYDNEVSIVAYIHRLDLSDVQAELMKKHKVDNITDLLKKKIAKAGNMQKLLKTVEKKFISYQSLNYNNMQNQEKIQTKLMEHGMMVQFDSKVEGATVDLYRYTPSIGLKMSQLSNYTKDIEQVLGISGVRILAPIPNSTLIGFEVPKKERYFPALPETSGSFNLLIGQTLEGEDKSFDIREAPHLLIAGATGSGKSVFMKSLIKQIVGIDKAELVLLDPKMVELVEFSGQAKTYKSNTEDIMDELENLVEDMNDRYEEMQKQKANNISQVDGMKYKFVFIDEFGDLTANNSEVQGLILLLAQKARAAGIHLVVATQRPSVDVISGTIKANFPTKAVFRVAKEVDSRVVLDQSGAEKLAGKGDMLFSSDKGVERLQGFNV